MTQEVVVKSVAVQEISLGAFAVEEEVSIDLHPAHALVSELVREPNGEVKYRYQPKPSFKGRDRVQIKINKITNTKDSAPIRIKKINFTVEV